MSLNSHNTFSSTKAVNSSSSKPLTKLQISRLRNWQKKKTFRDINSLGRYDSGYYKVLFTDKEYSTLMNIIESFNNWRNSLRAGDFEIYKRLENKTINDLLVITPHTSNPKIRPIMRTKIAKNPRVKKLVIFDPDDLTF